MLSRLLSCISLCPNFRLLAVLLLVLNLDDAMKHVMPVADFCQYGIAYFDVFSLGQQGLVSIVFQEQGAWSNRAAAGLRYDLLPAVLLSLGEVGH